jgi:hypothetical protein
MTSPQCPRLWQIDAHREGRLGAKDTESLQRHLRTCATCAAQMESDERLRALSLALHADEPNALALRRLRARVLRDAATGVRPSPYAASWRRASMVAAFVVACSVGVAFVVRRSRPHSPLLATAPTTSTTEARATDPPPPPSDPFAGTVTGEEAARWSQNREQGIERIDLEEGTIHVHVRPQDAGERFLVIMRDGELEVRGTTFDVTVQGGETTRVRSGVVELRLRGRPVMRLVDGDAWTPSSAVSLLLPRAPASAGIVRALPPAPADVDDGVSSYTAAMQRLRGAHYEEAAAAFHAFVAAWPRSSQAEDASFLEAVALARAGRPDAAGLAAERHLATFPASFHRKEAAILEARAAALRGECDSGRTVLGPWLGPNPDADAVATLRGCAR